MKKKITAALFILLFGQTVFADAIISRMPVQNSSGARSSVLYRSGQSNIVYGNYNKIDIDATMYKAAAAELKRKIAKNPDKISYYINLADIYVNYENYSDAIKTLMTVETEKKDSIDFETKKEAARLAGDIKIKPKNDNNRSDYYSVLAALALITDDLGQAENYVNRALSGAYKETDLRPVAYDLLKRTNNQAFAIVTCDKFLQKNPNDLEMRKIKADFLERSGNKTAAVAEYSRIIVLNPSDKEALYNLYKRVSTGNDSDRVLLSKIYNTDKPEKNDYKRMYSDLSDVLLKHNENAAAEKYAKLLIERFPDSADGYIILAEVYRRNGKLKEACDVLEKSKDKVNNNEQISKYNVALAKMSDKPLAEAHSLMNAGLYKQALEVLESADVNNLYVLISSARAAYFSGMKQKSLDYLNKAMVLYPNNADVYSAFAYIYVNENDIESARKYINKSLKLEPENKTSLSVKDMINKAEADSYKKSAAEAADMQDYDKLEKIADKALSIDSKNAEMYYFKGLALIHKCNYKDAVTNLKKSTEYDKNNADAYYSLGMAFDYLSDKQNAMKNYKKYLELSKDTDFDSSDKKEYAKVRIKKIAGF